MAVRPPQGTTDEPDAVEFGIAALDARLEEADVEFPATAADVTASLDDTAIPYDAAGNTLELTEALDRLPTDRFDSESELLELLHPVFEDRRETTPGSVVARLRSILPF